jgi:hypothetical protein
MTKQPSAKALLLCDIAKRGLQQASNSSIKELQRGITVQFDRRGIKFRDDELYCLFDGAKNLIASLSYVGAHEGQHEMCLLLENDMEDPVKIRACLTDSGSFVLADSEGRAVIKLDGIGRHDHFALPRLDAATAPHYEYIGHQYRRSCSASSH